MPDRAERVRELFHDALELTAEERSRFLAAECGNDEPLRTEVEALLGSLHEAGGFLADQPSTSLGETSGSVIDRYKLLQPIGEGGFGVVWAAEQLEPVRRRVALKVIKLGMDTRQVVARFEAERQALALMDHPNIAKVLDGGATPAGRPYFVMELVRGEPITQFCDRAGLTPRERLRLFQKVCGAVQHAHQKGIIHRDLKPGNVLVTLLDGVPSPKVIDFGIAKATNQELTRRTLFTDFRQMIGTPEYMAPEQAQLSALDVDTRADVYSLGVILYELLTGTKPVDANTLMAKGYEELLRHIREVDPPRPSTRLTTLGDRMQVVARQRGVEPQDLGRLLRGELDWIVMRALEKDRARRYETAVALAEDLQRYLDDLPVEAGPPGALYRSRKLFRRHRGAVLTVLFVFVFAVVAAVISTNSAIVAVRSRNEARTHLDEALRLQALAQQQSYIANIYAAEAALRAHDGQDARRRLDAAPRELRRWEWDFLACRADRSDFTLQPVAGKSNVMAVNSDGSLLAAAWADQLVRIFESDTGREVAQLTGCTTRVVAAAFSATGDWIYAGTESGELVGWAWRQGRRLTFAGHERGVRGLHASADGTLVVTGAWDGTVKIWNAGTGALVRTLQHAAPVHLVVLSPDGSRIAAATWDQLFTLWETATGRQIRTATAARAETPILAATRWAPAKIEALCFDPGSSRLVTGTRDGMLRVWSATDGVQLWENGFHRDVIRAVTVSADGERVAVASLDRTATLWHLASGERIASLLDHRDDVRGVAFSPDSNVLATVSWDHSARLWDGRRGLAIGTLLGHAQGVYDVDFLGDGARAATRSEDGTIRVWSLAPVLRETLHGHRSHVLSVAFATPSVLVTSCLQGAIKVWDLDRGRLLFDALGPADGTRCIAVGADGGQLAVALSDHSIGLWSLDDGRRLRSLEGHGDEVLALAFSRDGRRLVSGSADHTVRLWDLASGHADAVLEGHRDQVTAVAFGTGRTVVTCSRDGTARVWNGESGVEIRRLVCGAAANCLAVHPDGGQLALGLDDRSIVIFDLASGERLGSLHGHGEWVTALAWLPDGSRLISGSADWTVRLWDPETGDNVCTLQGHARQVRTVAVSPDGRRIASGSEDSAVRVWEVPR